MHSCRTLSGQRENDGNQIEFGYREQISCRKVFVGAPIQTWQPQRVCAFFIALQFPKALFPYNLTSTYRGIIFFMDEDYRLSVNAGVFANACSIICRI